MKISELLFEMDVRSEITNDLMDLITTYRQKNQEQIPMNGNNGAIAYLQKLGYSVNPNELMELLSKPPFDDVIENSDQERITLKSLNPQIDPTSKHKQQAKDKVEKTAAKVATKAVQTGDKLK